MTRKRPRQLRALPTDKTPRRQCSDCDLTNHQKPTWRLSAMDMEGPFGWGELMGAGIFWDEIFPKLKEFESMTWGEIEGRRHHAISVDGLSRKARARLREIQMDDIDEVFSFALAGTHRIIGIRDRHALKILWWDPHHQVCLSKKRHT